MYLVSVDPMDRSLICENISLDQNVNVWDREKIERTFLDNQWDKMHYIKLYFSTADFRNHNKVKC